MRQIAIYGKGGIGKSTISSNLAASLAMEGIKVGLIGCDPKGDSTRNLMKGRKIPAVLDILRQEGSTKTIERDSIIFKGFNDVTCVESGGPEPGIGCAGRGVIEALSTITSFGFYNDGYEIILYDVLGDVVCGGFATPIRQGFAQEIYIVVSGEYMSLYAANNICRGVKVFADRGVKTRVAGFIVNSRNVPREKEFAEIVAKAIGTQIISVIPRDNTIGDCERQGMTTIEAAPQSEAANMFRGLAKSIINNKSLVIPKPLSNDELEELLAKFQLKEKGEA
jgi:Mo-nitrogenase iron protein subunit NifH (EC 1.18.6.1)